VHPQPFIMNTHSITPEHFHSDSAYVFVTTDEPRHSLSDEESADLRWLTRQQVANLRIGEDIWANTQRSYLAIFDTFLQEWQPVSPAEFRLDKIV